jgi:hypothetical protein
LQHDVILWRTIQAVRQKQPALIGEDVFFLTCDYTFWRFDHKRLSRNTIGISVLPNVLLQLLRPFVPRTADFDRGFVSTFALPEFRTIHIASPQAVSRVAGIIRLYADLPEDVAVAILTDDALLTRVTRLDESDPAIADLIESAIVSEASRWKEEAERLSAQIRQEQETMKSTSDALSRAQLTAEEHIHALQAVREQLEQERHVRTAFEANASAERTAHEIELKKHDQEVAAATERAYRAEAARAQADDELSKTRSHTRRLRALIYALTHLLLSVAIIAVLLRYCELTVREHNSVVVGGATYGLVAATAELTSWFRGRKQRLLVRILWMSSCAAGVALVWVGIKQLTSFAILAGALVTLATSLLTALFQSE